MLENISIIIYDDGKTWNATITHYGWLSWTADPIRTIGYHSTYKEANKHIILIYKILREGDDTGLIQ